MFLTSFSQGVLLGGSLIIAIGLQNAFILRQGLLKRHIFLSAFTASICDACLIMFGVLGFGKVMQSIPLLEPVMVTGAILFLIWYGFQSFRNVYKTQTLTQEEAKGLVGTGTQKETIIAILGITLLNPHALLDTVVLLGSISMSYTPPYHITFGLGAICASFLWFFSLCYGASYLNPLFAKPKAWQILDVVIGVVMWVIAGGLMVHYF